MKIRNINPQGDVQVAALNFQLVRRGEVIEVAEDIAAMLLIQAVNWDLPDKAPKGDQEFAAKVIAEHVAALVAASQPPVQFVEDHTEHIETPGEDDQA